MDNQIGEKIAILRKTNNFSQNDLAQKLCVSNKTISKWECGNSIPDVETLKKLADIFHVSVDYFVNDTPTIKNNSKTEIKKFSWKLIVPICVASFVVLLAILLAVFIPRAPKVSSSAFDIDTETSTMSCTVNNNNESFSFNGKINVPFRNTWKLYSDINATNEITSNVVQLEEGNNTFYLLVTSSNNEKKLYTIVIRRKPMYIVTFNTDGGTDVERQIIEEGQFVSLPEEPTKVGYTFIGWDYDFTQEIIDDTIIFANWAPNTYTILFHSNDVQATGTMDPLVADYGCYYLINNHFIKNGYSVKKWTTNSDGTGIQITDGQIISNLITDDNGVIDLYANWEIDTYYITYNCNGWSGGVVENPITYTIESENLTLNPLNSPATFLGWTNDDGDFVSNIPTGSTGNIALTAQWDITDFNYSLTPTEFNITGLKNNEISEIIIPNGATTIKANAFKNKTNITSVTVPNTVTSILSGAFSGCSALQSISLPFVGKSAAIAIDAQFPIDLFGYIFGTNTYDGGTITAQKYIAADGTINTVYYCIPDSLEEVNITGTTLPNYAFSSCANINTIALSKNITIIGENTFDGCSSLSNIEINNDNTMYSSIDGNLYSKDATELIKYAVGKQSATFTIPNTVTTIRSMAFNESLNLKSLIVPNNVTNIALGALHGCCNLVSITLPFVGDSAKAANETYKYSFGYIFGTENYNSSTATSQQYIITTDEEQGVGFVGDKVETTIFYIPTSLKTVTITNGNIFHGAFQNCTMLEQVVLPTSLIKIGARAFEGCSSLNNIIIPETVTNIGDVAFYGCIALQNIHIPSLVTGISYSTFADCSSLLNITFSQDIHMLGIGNYAFLNCISLTQIFLPTLQNGYASNAFSGCANLTIYNYSETEPTDEGNYWHYVDNTPTIWE